MRIWEYALAAVFGAVGVLGDAAGREPVASATPTCGCLGEAAAAAAVEGGELV